MEIQRQTESFAYRVAATMNFDKAEDLEGEFNEWFDENQEAQELDPVYERRAARLLDEHREVLSGSVSGCVQRVSRSLRAGSTYACPAVSA